jgi:hypothetical protein
VGKSPVVGMVLGAVAVVIVGIQMASETETPPTSLVILDYILLAMGIAGGVGSLVVYLKQK